MKIRVAIAGAGGRMGSEVVRALQNEKDLSLTGAANPAFAGQDAGKISGMDSLGILVEREIEGILASCDVLVDFTHPDQVYANALLAIEAGVRPVIGTTGLTSAQIEELEKRCREKKLGGILAPNFAVGAILMMRFAQLAARHFGSAEIIELHHDQKADAPSGTAIKTAELMLAERKRFGLGNAPETEKIPGARGGSLDGIRLHSIRLPGLVAHQEVIFGGKGETLTIRHDSLSRESFMPGVILAIRKVMELDGFVYGLENLI
ncbi:MAG TPA: 4-hydroxy-tetrahydrodipicolinate reductase [Cyanobacteria bacterium UBA8530]|nr:4-hydroxy-tetrahydrodipicolinate reductase [Cyanobacteria bacterium UBA8530]